MSAIRIEKDGESAFIYFEGSLWKKSHKSILSKVDRSFYQLTSLQEAEVAFFVIEEKAAKEIAIKSLSLKSLFSSELEDKLLKKGFSLEAVEKALDFCRKMGALDDKTLAERKVLGDLSKGRGVSLAFYKLKKLVNRDVILLELENTDRLEKESIVRYLKKKKIDQYSESFTREVQAKVFSSLLRRGFKKENIHAVFKGLDEEDFCNY